MKIAGLNIYNTSALFTRFLAGAALCSYALSQEASALPQGGTVASGQATVSQPSASQLVVTQSSNKGIINWQSFNIGSGESTQFVQPSTNSFTLNRVAAGNPSKILGSLSANGQLMLVNPDGIFFGRSSKVNVGGLIASTSDISDANFNAGRYLFNRPGRADASIVNKGTITAAQGGLVALVAPAVRNDGVIAADLGTVALGSGSAFTVDFYGDHLYSFAVDSGATAQAKDENGQPLKAAITNNGKVSAKGGTVYMTARAASNVVSEAINNTGIVEATSARKVGGTIVLDGGEGNVENAGLLDVSGKGAGQQGGSVRVTGKQVKLASGSVIDATGQAGGGDVAIGGQARGKGTLKHAKSVTAEAGSVIDVSALDNGNAGSAILWSDGATQSHGAILARGGANGGDGGFIETSGETLDVAGSSVLTGAPKGKGGLWLLDPYDDTIDLAQAATIGASLNAGGAVEVDATHNIEVAAPILKTAGLHASLTLDAGNDILFDRGAGIANIAAVNGLDVTLTAGRNVTLNGSPTAGVSFVSANNITVNAQNVSLFGGSYLSVGSLAADVLNVNNTGTFYSDTAHILFGPTVNLNQNLPGSIQNAIYSIAFSVGKTTLTVGSGIWQQLVNINGYSNFTLTGKGQAGESATIIQPLSVSAAPQVRDVSPNGSTYYSPIVLALNGTNDTVSNLTVSGAGLPSTASNAVGLVFKNAGGTITDVTVSEAPAIGILALSQSTYGNGPRTVNVENANVSGSLQAAMKAAGDDITFNVSSSLLDGSGGVTGMDYANGSQGLFSNNTVYSGTLGSGTDSATGISFHGAHDVTVTGDSIYGNEESQIGIADEGYASGNYLPADNIIVTHSDIEDFATGISGHGGNNWTVTDNTIASFAGGTGIALDSVTGSTIGSIGNGNTISGFDTGVTIDNSTTTGVSFNDITVNDNGTGISASSGDQLSILGNTINVASTFFFPGFEISSDIEPIFPFFPGTGQTGIALSNVTNSTVGASASGYGNSITGFNTGISVDGSSSSSISYNTIQVNDGGIGISASNSGGLNINGNTLTVGDNGGFIFEDLAEGPFDSSAVGAIGISLDNVTNSTIGDSAGGNANSITNFYTGIQVTDNSAGLDIGSNAIDTASIGISIDASSAIGVTGNTLTNISGDGIDSFQTAGLTISGNSIMSDGSSADGTGIYVDSGTGANLLSGNTVGNFSAGIDIDSTDGVRLSSNRVTGQGEGSLLFTEDGTAILNSFGSVGAIVENSNNVSFSGDTFTNNLAGIALSNAQDTVIDNVNVSNNTVGIGVVNGSGGTLVSGSNFDSNTVAIGLDGEGSSLQFDTNKPSSSFSNDDYYFVLQDGAMNGQVLDASQQRFDGTFAYNFNFTPQYIQAESRTIDSHTPVADVGTVFYKDFSNNGGGTDNPGSGDSGNGGGGTTGTGNGGATNGAAGTPANNNNTVADLHAIIPLTEFSLAEPFFSFAGQTILQNPPIFRVQQVNLNLLTPGAGGNGQGGTSLPNLTPAAGGDNPTGQLSDLSPAAGGNCANGFLSAGYTVGYNPGNCN